MTTYKSNVTLFHNTTGLPIQLIDKNCVQFSLPSSISTLQQLLYKMHITECFPALTSKHKGLISLSSNFNEDFIAYFMKEETFVLVGPFVTYVPKKNEILHLLELQNLPFSKRSFITSYFNSLSNLSNKRTYYSGKLLIELFETKSFIPTSNYNLTNNKNLTSNILPQSVFPQILRSSNMQFVHAPYFFEKNISMCIKNGDLNGAKDILNEINTLPRANLAMNPVRSLKNSLIASCTFMTRATIDGGVTPNTAFFTSDILIRKIEDTNDLQKLKDFEKDMIISLIDLVNQTKEANFSKLIRNSIDYITINLCDTLNVSTIASNVFANPNYLSTQFKKEVGISITKFIQKKRIDGACFYLRYTNRTISDISLTYLFSSQSYFDKIFKKFKGITPKEYRNSIHP